MKWLILNRAPEDSFIMELFGLGSEGQPKIGQQGPPRQPLQITEEDHWPESDTESSTEPETDQAPDEPQGSGLWGLAVFWLSFGL